MINILNLLSILIIVALFWSYFLYPLILFKYKKSLRPLFENYQNISMIIPTFNEEHNIVQKILNCKLLDYPLNKIEIIFIDGGSNDKTCEIIKSSFSKNMKLIEMLSRHGKINDINRAMKLSKGDIIIISDADSILSKNAIKEINKYLSLPKVGAVGICTLPYSSQNSELEHWVISNKLRFLESSADSAFSLTASCYGFKKGLIKEFPADVIADDMYTALSVRKQGYRAVYISDARALELRAPLTSKQRITHKFRKSIADIHEIFRFKFSLIDKSVFGGIIYPTLLYYLLISPAITTLLPIYSVILFIISPFYLFPFFVCGVLLILGANRLLFGKISHPKLPKINNSKIRLFSIILNIFLINLILLCSLLYYPFIKKTSKYSRIESPSLPQ